ncbi:MAG TPA: sulfatase-like hydrolase/transferase, partial [Acidimicrobiales bacterium]|nr:sulfatase-like hydrolase/transferase [Acidimicrobiales bacterium]
GKWHTPAHPMWQEAVQFYAFADVADATVLHPPYTDEAHHVIKNPGSFMDTVDIPVIIGGVYPHHDWGNDPGSALTEMGIEWLREASKRDEPFLLRVSYAWPHTPVLPPSPWDRLYEPDEVKCNALQQQAHDERSSYDRWLANVEGGMRMTADQWKRAAADYYGLCSYIDHEVGRLMRALRDLGLADDTIVAFNTDHGRAMGEYGHLQKGTFDTEVWRVPFIISAPSDVPKGEHRHDLCELLDFVPTVCSLAGIDLAPGMRGRDLFDATQPEPDAVFGLVDMFAHRRVGVRTKRYRYDCSYLYDESYTMQTDKTAGDDRRANLIDLENDPLELHNLINDPSAAAIADELYARLDTWMEKAE